MEPHRQQALDVDAVEVGLDLWDAAAGRQGLHEGHQAGRHGGVQQADEDVRGVRCPEPPCKHTPPRCSRGWTGKPRDV